MEKSQIEKSLGCERSIFELAEGAMSLVSPVYETQIPLNSLGYSNLQTHMMRRIYNERSAPTCITESGGTEIIECLGPHGSILVKPFQDTGDFLIEGSVDMDLGLPDGPNPLLFLLKRSTQGEDLTMQQISQKRVINARVTKLSEEPSRIIKLGGRKGRIIKRLISNREYEIWGEIHNLSTEGETGRNLVVRFCPGIT